MANCKLCDHEIIFDDWHVSQKTGKKIPLDVYTEQPHDCPIWKQQQRYNRRRHYYPCRNCSADIYFDNAQKSKNGIWVPIDKQTCTPHHCPLTTGQ
jgi:hypothetical protein